jgi:hypothetical protein
MVHRSVVFTIAVMASLPGTVSGAGLRFSDIQPRTLTWAELGGGAASPSSKAQLELCNLGRHRVGPIAVRPVGFGFTGTNVTGDESFLSAKPDRRFLPRDSCTQVRLSARATPSQGTTNTGAIVATARRGNLARFKLTVSAPPAAPTPAQPAPANATQQLSARRWAPFMDAHLGSHSDLIVLVPDGAGPLPSKGLLGVLTAGDDTASVFADGDAVTTGDHVQRLPIRVDGASRGATYSGSVTLTGFEHRSDDGAPTVDLSIVTQDVVFWPILAILLGLTLPFLAALELRRWLPIKLLRDDRESALDAYDAAAVTFRKQWPGDFPGYAPPSEEQRKQFREQVENDIDAAKDGVWLLDLDGDTWKASRKAVADAREDAARFAGNDSDDLGPSLGRLSAALIAAEGLHAGDEGGVPPFLAEGRALLQGGPLPVGGAGIAAAEADRVTAVAVQWAGLRRRAAFARAWLDHLPSDETEAQIIRERLDEVTWLVLQVKEAEDVSSHRLDERLDGIERRLLRLATRKGWWRPGDPETLIETGISYAIAPREGDRRVSVERLSLPKLFQQLVPEQARAAVAQASHHALEWAVLLIALALGVLAGLRQVYFGKPFGTLDDYIGLILLGAASAVVSPFLTGAAKKLKAAGSHLPFLG